MTKDIVYDILARLTSDNVELIARQICVVEGIDPNEDYTVHEPHPTGRGTIAWSVPNWHKYREEARRLLVSYKV